jgi:hypothetical protein
MTLPKATDSHETDVAESSSGNETDVAESSSGNSVRVKSVQALFEDHGLAAPDEYGGPESSKYFLDYGPPEVLADSDRSHGRTKHEEELADQLRELASRL